MSVQISLKFSAFLRSSQVSLQNVRNMSKNRESLYGWEFGHSYKNEVRKEKWIRKKCIKSNGTKWREDNGFQFLPLANGKISRMPDWSDPETKLPGSLTIEQERAQKEQLELAKAVFEAAMLVKKAQSL